MANNNDLYEKELRRIKKLIEQANKNGITFIHSPIPKAPDIISKDYLESLSKISLSDIMGRGHIIDEESGELIPFKKASSEYKRGRNVAKFDEQGGVRFKKPEDPPLSEEELKRIRSEAGKKAQESIKRRMEIDPEYAERITLKRKEAISKARETIKRKMQEDPEYAEQIRNKKKESLVKAREASSLKRREKQENLERQRKEQKEKQRKKPEDEDLEIPIGSDDINDSPEKGETILENVMEILRGGLNTSAVNFALQTLNNACAEFGEDEVAKRLAYAEHSVIESARLIAFDSDPKKVYDSTQNIINLIYNGEVPNDIESRMNNNYSTVIFEEVEDEELPF